MTRTYGHTCVYCRKVHARGSKNFDRSGQRCVKREGCTLKPVKVTLWKPHGSCVGCGAKTKRGVRRCTNNVKCLERVVKRMVNREHDEAWERERYVAEHLHVELASPQRETYRRAEEARKLVAAVNERAEAVDALNKHAKRNVSGGELALAA